MRKNRVFTFFLLALVAFTSCKEEQKQTPSSYCHRPSALSGCAEHGGSGCEDGAVWRTV